MSRLFIYDENMVDERAKITVAKMAAVSDIVAPEKQYIQYTNKGEVTVLAGMRSLPWEKTQYLRQ